MTSYSGINYKDRPSDWDKWYDKSGRASVANHSPDQWSDTFNAQ